MEFLCVDSVHELDKGSAALGGVLVDTGILQNGGKDLAGFLQDDVQSVVLGEGVLLLQGFYPLSVLVQLLLLLKLTDWLLEKVLL